MGHIFIIRVIFIAKFIIIFPLVNADTYSVKISTESHINLVDNKFLSFTIDPKYLFSSSGEYDKEGCICMASSLTPAYIRIAGPSTSHTTFHNATISIDAFELLDDEYSPLKISLNEHQKENIRSTVERQEHVSVSHEEWEKFVQWAKKTGFDLVFALNNDEKTLSGMWDPNTALSILTIAEKANIGDIFWQLGYECNNQSIEEYLNDLETLRVITETFPLGKAGRWRVVGGDVTPCLTAESKSDFKDYLTLSDEMFDAVFLNGNSSSQELERMSEKDRLKLLKVLSQSDTPLWLTEKNHRFHELERAADWMTSLGYSAKSGFSVHFRELVESELYEPTLSFYMALLFKNLVGERVLNVDIEASEATMFAHCTSLRQKPVPGAVTLYGANMDVEPARFSIKLSKKEEGGDIMQFILGHDHSGNIVVNGRAMYYEGDIKPVVKRVRPYKTLLLNLPPKSFGFWVLANTQVDACYDIDDEPKQEKQYVEALPVESDEDNYSSIMKSKRSLNMYHVVDHEPSITENVELLNNTEPVKDLLWKNKTVKNRTHELNEDLNNILNVLPWKQNGFDDIDKTYTSKVKRQVYNGDDQRNKRKMSQRDGFNSRNYKGSQLISKLRNSKVGRNSRLFRNRISKRNSKGLKRNFKSRKGDILNNGEKTAERRKNNIDKVVSETRLTNPECDSGGKRKRRSIDKEKRAEHDVDENGIRGKKYGKFKNLPHNQLNDDTEEVTLENDITDKGEGLIPMGKILHKIKKISRYPIEIQENHEERESDDDNEDTSDMNEIVLKTKLLDDSAVIKILENSKNGFVKSTIEEVLSVLADLNKNMKKVWSALSFLE